MNKSELAGKLKDALDRKCKGRKQDTFCLGMYHGQTKENYLSKTCQGCQLNRDLAQELADIAEEHYKEEQKCKA